MLTKTEELFELFEAQSRKSKDQTILILFSYLRFSVIVTTHQCVCGCVCGNEIPKQRLKRILSLDPLEIRLIFANFRKKNCYAT